MQIQDKVSIQFLIELFSELSGININAPTKLGLDHAARRGLESVVEVLLAARKSETDGWGLTALHHAADKGHDKIVTWLLAFSDIHINANKNRHWKTALHCALDKGHKDVARILLSTKGININMKDLMGY